MMYDKFPVIPVPNAEAWSGWEAIGNELKQAADCSTKKIIVLECYQGVMDEEIIPAFQDIFSGALWMDSRDCYKPAEEIEKMVFPDVTDDAIFGYMTRLNMIDYFDAGKLKNAQEKIASNAGFTVVYGPGASLMADQPDLLAYLDMARWEIQLRMRSNKVNNLGVQNKEASFSHQYKQAYFVDWRVCDRLKKKLFHKTDFLIDTNKPGHPKMIRGSVLLETLEGLTERPFRVMPFFDPGPWGGQWMKAVCDLDRSVINYAWAFDCVPEENSLLLQVKDTVIEIPSINLVFLQPEKLLGAKVYARFGDEFPIRFDFLDTMEGGNLSLQVHPLTEYIQEKFGMKYTQDESYYMMEAQPGAVVYLGLKKDIDKDAMMADLQTAQEGIIPFDADKYVNTFPVKKHDHISIPAGTIHCSGTNSVVLEISATPYIFTFKLWDWGRVGLDGKPRPINIEHGKNVIQWNRDTDWVKQYALTLAEKVEEGDGYTEEKTGLNESQFIETRRHWFTKKVTHYTNGSVNVLNLVEGDAIIVESPENKFDPFTVHYAETFIVPAFVHTYTIRPLYSDGKQHATIKAYVRG
ncbi:MAG: class I mannose-6-phosphate isomerase [Niabella sp.]